MPKKVTLILVMMLLGAVSFAQTVITGKVVDASGPVIGAAVIEAGTSNGTSTDVDGSFTLTVSGNPTIEISSIGYATQSFPARSVPSVVTLVEDNEFIEETVVVGYGVQKKSNVTGAIASVKAETLQNRSNENVVSSLQGKVAGVQVVSTSGAPGSGSSFRIRGYSSTNSSPDPLILVDGLKVRSIDYLDPESVESIEVLKDAASAAIYGSQAGNGVVLVTTKSGSEANTRIFYNNMFSFRSPMENIKMLNAQQFKDYWMQTGEISESQFQNADTNWQHEMFETGFQQRHTVGLQGGNNRFSYYVDATYMNNNGIIVGDKDLNERVTGQVNVSYQIQPWIKVGTNISIERGKMTSVSENSSIATGSILGAAYYYDPTTPVAYLSESELPSDPNFDYRAAEAAGLNPMKDADGHYYGQSFLLTSNMYNPLAMLSIRNYTNWRTNINGTAYTDITPLKGLTFTSRFGFRLSSSYSKSFTPRFWVHAFQQSTNVSISGTDNNQQYYQWENFANYLKSFGKHDISAMAGMEFASTRYESINASANGLVNENERFWYLSYYDPTALSRTMGGSDYSRNNLSFFGRLAYTYDERYNLQASIRSDAYGMSKLSKSNRWGVFPSVSAGWTVSNEPFFKNALNRDIFSFLKFRASWGINGNIDSLSDFTWTNSMSLSGYYNINDTGMVTNANPSTILANPDLSWEESRQIDFGVDARFFRDRLSLGVDYYSKNTTNMLASIVAPAVSGTTTTYVNRGKINNSGVEIDLSWRDGIGKDFTYSVTANLSTVHNMVVESPQGSGRYTPFTWATFNMDGANFFTPIAYLEEGYPMWYLRTNKVKEFDSNGNAVFYSAEELGTDDGRDYSGDGIPDFTYGLTINLAYKNFDLTVFANGVQGVEKFLTAQRPDLPIANVPEFVYKNRWTASNPENAIFPKPTTNMGYSVDYAGADFWAFDASYFKIKQIQLGYTLPQSALRKMHLKGLRIYGSVENAFTFTTYPGNDPESMAGTYGANIALDRVSYPSTKNFIFGMNLSF